MEVVYSSPIQQHRHTRPRTTDQHPLLHLGEAPLTGHAPFPTDQKVGVSSTSGRTRHEGPLPGTWNGVLCLPGQSRDFASSAATQGAHPLIAGRRCSTLTLRLRGSRGHRLAE